MRKRKALINLLIIGIVIYSATYIVIDKSLHNLENRKLQEAPQQQLQVQPPQLPQLIPQEPAVCWHKNPAPEGYKHFLIGCVLFKNERPYLDEWLVYHQLAGFDHLYMYNDNSTDKPEEVLQPYIDEGFVTLIPWGGHAPGVLQTEQVLHCWNNYAPQSKWTSIFDVDEFIVSFYEWDTPKPGFFSRILDKYYQWKAGIELRRANFDTNGNKSPPKDLTIKAYISRWTDENTAAKLVLQHKYIAVIGGHVSAPKEGYEIVDARGRDVSKERVFVDHPLRMNHYITRSYDECVAKKNQSAFPGSWRSNPESKYCEGAHAGTEHYYPPAHFVDDYLSSHYATMVETCLKQHLNPPPPNKIPPIKWAPITDNKQPNEPNLTN